MSDPNQDDLPKPAEPEQTEANDATTDTLVGRTLKIAAKFQGLLLAYLVSVAATIGAMKLCCWNW